MTEQASSSNSDSDARNPLYEFPTGTVPENALLAAELAQLRVALAREQSEPGAQPQDRNASAEGVRERDFRVVQLNNALLQAESRDGKACDLAGIER